MMIMNTFFKTQNHRLATYREKGSFTDDTVTRYETTKCTEYDVNGRTIVKTRRKLKYETLDYVVCDER